LVCLVGEKYEQDIRHLGNTTYSIPS